MPSTVERRWHRWFRPTLIWLIGFVFVVALWLGWITNSARTQRLAFETIRQSNGRAEYQSHMGSTLAYRFRIQGPGAKTQVRRHWFKKLLTTQLGIDYAENIVAVGVLNPEPAAIRAIANLHELRVLELTIAQTVGNDTLARLKHLKRLQRLVLSHAPISNEGLAHLSGLTELRSLVITESPAIDDLGIRHLRELKHLKTLIITNAHITSDGLRELDGMSELESLYLIRTAIDDKGLMQLARLPALKLLDVRGTLVTSEGVAKVKQANPRVRIIFP